MQDYTLEGGLNTAQLDILHDRALELCETEGIRIDHDGILEILAQYNGVKIEDHYVKFRRDLVLEALKAAVYDEPERAKNNWIISAGAAQLMYYDPGTGVLRKPLSQDLVDLIKLGDALDTSGSAPVVPSDIPNHLQHIFMYKISYEYSRYRGNDIYEHMDKPTVECAEYVYEMALAAGKRYAYALWFISPRSIDPKGLDIAYRLIDKKIPMNISTMPIAGVTAPITMIGCALQSMFEVFSGLTMLHLINPDANNYIAVNDAFEAGAFDMKDSTFVYGSPEYVRHTMFQLSLCKYYGIPANAKSFLTSSKEPDAQMAAEISAHTLIAAMGGARVFRCAGLLSTSEIYCAEQLVLCHEILEHIKHILKHEEFSEDRLLMDEIREVKAGMSFLDRDSTAQMFRSEYWYPDLFTHTNINQWRLKGSRNIRDIAGEKAKKLIAQHIYTADADVRKELNKIYKTAENDIQLKDSFSCI